MNFRNIAKKIWTVQGVTAGVTGVASAYVGVASCMTDSNLKDVDYGNAKPMDYLVVSTYNISYTVGKSVLYGAIGAGAGFTWPITLPATKYYLDNQNKKKNHVI